MSEDEIRRAFKVFDKYNDGKIRVDLLRSVLSKVGEPLSEKELTNFLEMMNLSDKDTIDYEELCSTYGFLRHKITISHDNGKKRHSFALCLTQRISGTLFLCNTKSSSFTTNYHLQRRKWKCVVLSYHSMFQIPHSALHRRKEWFPLW